MDPPTHNSLQWTIDTPQPSRRWLLSHQVPDTQGSCQEGMYLPDPFEAFASCSSVTWLKCWLLKVPEWPSSMDLAVHQAESSSRMTSCTSNTHLTHWSDLNHRLYVSPLHTGDMYPTGDAIYMGSLKWRSLCSWPHWRPLCLSAVDVVISWFGSTRDAD